MAGPGKPDELPRALHPHKAGIRLAVWVRSLAHAWTLVALPRKRYKPPRLRFR